MKTTNTHGVTGGRTSPARPARANGETTTPRPARPYGETGASAAAAPPITAQEMERYEALIRLATDVYAKRLTREAGQTLRDAVRHAFHDSIREIAYDVESMLTPAPGIAVATTTDAECPVCCEHAQLTPVAGTPADPIAVCPKCQASAVVMRSLTANFGPYPGGR